MTRQEAAEIARMVKARNAPTLKVRFWSKVNILGTNECWPWTAAIRRKDDGYGAFWMNGRHHPSNRIAWELENGPIPKGMVICHKCDNPSCCNPIHLFIGSPLDNNNDKVNKGRQSRGVMVNTAKLTEKEVIEIKSLKPPKGEHAKPGLKDFLSKKYGVSKSTIYAVWHIRWRHLNENQ